MTNPFALIVEDDPNLGFVFATTLQQLGYETGLDANGDRYREFLSNRIPALILLDLHLPYASGKEILEQIRSDPRFVNTAIIVATADLFSARSVGAEGKADYVLLKPVRVARLIEIATHIQSSARQS